MQMTRLSVAPLFAWLSLLKHVLNFNKRACFMQRTGILGQIYVKQAQPKNYEHLADPSRSCGL